MASTMTDWMLLCSNLVLSATAFYSSCQLFKDHRAPAIGLFLLGVSAGLSILRMPNQYLVSLQNDLEWSSEVLALPLVSFGFLWLSEDHNTAHILLIGSCLFVGLSDWLSSDGLVLLTRCVALTSLSCCLTVCLFSGNALGALGSVALSLSSLVAPRFGVKALTSLMTPAASEGLLQWLLKGSMSIGCWASMRALRKFLLDVTVID